MSMPYELFIGLRYLKAKRKQSFISVISLISILGVMVGVAALIIVLSVMTGFELELREKILGVNAHMVSTESGGSMGGYNAVVDEVKGRYAVSAVLVHCPELEVALGLDRDSTSGLGCEDPLHLLLLAPKELYGDSCHCPSGRGAYGFQARVSLCNSTGRKKA